jgi:hypothetical protein
MKAKRMDLEYRFHREWVIEDFDNMPLEPFGEASAILCSENEALPGIGGEYNCLAANLTDSIYINRFCRICNLCQNFKTRAARATAT